MSIEGIALDHFSTIDTYTATLSHPWPINNTVFHSIFLITANNMQPLHLHRARRSLIFLDKESFSMHNVVPSGRIHMAVINSIDVQHHYTYYQYYLNHSISLLTVVSVLLVMERRLWMCLILQKKGWFFIVWPLYKFLVVEFLIQKWLFTL